MWWVLFWGVYLLKNKILQVSNCYKTRLSNTTLYDEINWKIRSKCAEYEMLCALLKRIKPAWYALGSEQATGGRRQLSQSWCSGITSASSCSLMAFLLTLQSDCWTSPTEASDQNQMMHSASAHWTSDRFSETTSYMQQLPCKGKFYCVIEARNHIHGSL